VEQSEFGFEEVTVSGGPEGTVGVTGETNSKFFMSTGTGFADGINVDVMQDINEQADLEHYGPTIKHVFRHELDLVPVKPKNARVRNTAVASEDNNEAKDVHIKVFDQSRDYRTDIIKLKVQKDSFIKILVGSRVLPDEELIAKSSLEQGYWNKMENKMKKKLAKTDRLTYEAMDSELKLMEKEITNMELETKETFFEHRELYKHLSIHDYEEVLMLNDNRNELRDFNFLPRWDENFVKEVN
jgi:DNA helicase IV